MAERKRGTVFYWQDLSPTLAIFRLMPESGSQFPKYKAGQYIALRRENCKLTKKVISANGKPDYVPDLDEHGNEKRGPVTHSYSISSAPFETEQKNCLEFYIILEINEKGERGRLTDSLFRINLRGDAEVTYFNRIAGDFTLDQRAQGFHSVLLVGTGTGLAPFAAIIKQLHFEATQGKSNAVRYTLLHTNRTYDELAYHQAMLDIEASQSFDFVYIPSVSRPTPQDLTDPKLGKGRANNLLRSIFEMPLKEEQQLQEAAARGEDVSQAKAAFEVTVKPVLPGHLSSKDLQDRLNPSQTVVLSCGNPMSMADIRCIADSNRMRFEKEDW